MENKNFLAAKFGIEVEFTGITRRQAAEVAARYLGNHYRDKGLLRYLQGYCPGRKSLEIRLRWQHLHPKESERREGFSGQGI